MPPAPKRSCSPYAPQLSAEARAEAGTAGRLRLLCARARPRCAPRRRHLAPGRDRRMGAARRPGSPASPRGGSAITMPPRPPSSRPPSSPSSASFAPAAIIGRRAPSRPRAARARSSRCSMPRRRPIDRKLLRPARARNARHGTPSCRPTRSSASIRRSTSLPNVQRAIELARIGETGAGRGDASPPGEDRRCRPSIMR